MRGEQYLNKGSQFALVYEGGGSRANRLVAMRVLANGLDFSRYGFSVSRRVGGAVVRNRVKRLLREIMRQSPLGAGRDIVLIARAPAAEASYAELRAAVTDLLRRAGLLVGEHEGACPGAD